MTGKKKGVSIGQAMKHRMGTLERDEADGGEELATQDSVPRPRTVTSPVTAVAGEDPLEPFNTRLPRSLQRRLKVHVAMENMKIMDALHEALDGYLKARGR